MNKLQICLKILELIWRIFFNISFLGQQSNKSYNNKQNNLSQNSLQEAKRRPVQTSKSNNSKCVPFVIMTEEPDTFYDSRYAAEINNRMRVPDRIMVAGENQTRSPTFVGINGPPSSFGRERVEQKVEMLVPDRILVAGGDRHIAAKSTPFEMQVENSVMPPSRHDVIIIMPTFIG